MVRILITVHALVLVAALAACDRGKPAGGKAPQVSAGIPAALPPGLFLAAAPADARDIKDAKGALKAGDKVVLVGRIGGSEEPFVAERAIFTIVDRRVKACGEGTAMDSCKTPWDYCCEPVDSITANSATIQVVGPEGQPVKAELNGVRGLKPLATVTVIGTVAKAEGGNLVVSASGFFVGP